MTDSKSLQGGISVDLGVLEQELRQQEPYKHEGHTARTLLRTPVLRVVLIAMKGGSRIAEHRTNEAVSIHAISGHLLLHLPERIVTLLAGQLLLLEGGLTHDVEAVTDSALVLTLGWRAQP